MMAVTNGGSAGCMVMKVMLRFISPSPSPGMVDPYKKKFVVFDFLIEKLRFRFERTVLSQISFIGL